MSQTECPHCQSEIGEPLSVDEKTIRSMRLAKRVHFCPNCYKEVEVKVKRAVFIQWVFIALIVSGIIFLSYETAVKFFLPVALLFVFYFKNNKEFIKGKRKYDKNTKSYIE